MQFKAMDETLVSINKIKNINSIQFYYIKDVVPAIIVTYDNGKILNLCSKDKYFIELVRKIRDVYKVEKDNVVSETIIGKKGIQIDEITKKIIENATLEHVNQLYSFYTDKSSYNESLLFQSDEFKMLLPIVKYHVETLFSKTNLNVCFDDEFTGYRNNYILTGKVDGVNKTFKIVFSNTRDNEYKFCICGLFSKCASLEVSIKFKRDKLEVELNIPNYGLYGLFTYIPCDNCVKEKIEISKYYLPLFYDEKNLDEFIPTEKIDNQDINLKWYMLPWNAMFATSCSCEDITESSKIIEEHNVYIQSDNKSFIEKENYSKRYIHKIKDGLNKEEVVLDEEIKNVTCLPLEDDIYVIETRFLSSRGTNGYYDEKLTDKYFYHIIESKSGIKKIIKEDSVNVDQSQINNKGDLLSKPRILSLLKGEK